MPQENSNMANERNQGIFACIGRRETGVVKPWEVLDVTRGSKNFIGRLGKWKVLTGHDGCVNTIAWNEQGNTILSGSDDCKLNIFDVGRNRILHSVTSGHRANIFSAKFLPFSSDSKIVSCCGSGMIHYNQVGMETLYGHNYFNCHAGTTYEVSVTPGDPNSFMTCGEDGTVRQYDLRIKSNCYCQECREDILVECGHAVTSLCVNPMNPYHLAIGCEDSAVRIYDRRTLGAAKEQGYFRRSREESPGLLCCFKPPNLKRERCRVTSLRYSNDGKEILVSYCTDYVYLFSMDEAYRLVEAKKLEQGNGTFRIRGGGSNQQSSNLPPMKRLRLRGDWSDTGPDARPENEEQEAREEATATDMNLALMQRLYGVFSRSLEEAFNITNPNASDTNQEEAVDPGQSEAVDSTHEEAESQDEADAENSAQRERTQEQALIEGDEENDRNNVEINLESDRGQYEIAGQCCFADPRTSYETTSSSSQLPSLRERGCDTCKTNIAAEDSINSINMEQIKTLDSKKKKIMHTSDSGRDFATRLANNITLESIQTVGRGLVSDQCPTSCDDRTISDELLPVENNNIRKRQNVSTTDQVLDETGDESYSGFRLSNEESRDFERKYTNSCENRHSENSPNESPRSSHICSAVNSLQVNEPKILLENTRVITRNDCENNRKSSKESIDVNNSEQNISPEEYDPLEPNIYAADFSSNNESLINGVEIHGNSTAESTEASSDRHNDFDSGLGSDKSRMSKNGSHQKEAVIASRQVGNDSLSCCDSSDNSHPDIEADTKLRAGVSESTDIQSVNEEPHFETDLPPQSDDSATRVTTDESTERSSSVRNAAAARIQRYFRSRKNNAEDRIDESDVSLLLEPKMYFHGHRNARTMIKEANFWGDDFILSGSDCGRIFIWDRHTGELVTLLEGDKHVVNCVQPHPFDSVLATSGIDHDVKVWAPILPNPAVLENVEEGKEAMAASRFHNAKKRANARRKSFYYHCSCLIHAENVIFDKSRKKSKASSAGARGGK